MRTFLAGMTAVILGALLAAPVLSAGAAPPPPSNVQITNVQIGATEASFVVTFVPARIDAKAFYPTYQFAVTPNFCQIAAPVDKGFRTLSYASGPYQVSVTCKCNRPYKARVSTYPPDSYTPRSVWVDSATVSMPCQR